MVNGGTQEVFGRRIGQCGCFLCRSI